MNTDLMFSSKSNEWSTPQDTFDRLNEEFNFTLDPCATDENHKCEKYYTIEDDGLLQDWSGESVFVNPPYGRGIKDWVKKAYEESQKPNTTVVMLIPARTETTYQQAFIFPYAKAVLFIKGRLKFGGHKNAAPFPSQVVIYSNSLTTKQIEALSKFGFLAILR
jgi:phage N-6-adenine-methyltransferase